MAINETLKNKIKKDKEKRESEIIKKENSKKSKLIQLKEALFFDYKREKLSRTALINFVFFALVVITWLVMIPVLVWVIVDSASTGKEIPTGLISAFFTWTAGLVTVGGFQYTAGKKISNGGQ